VRGVAPHRARGAADGAVPDAHGARDAAGARYPNACGALALRFPVTLPSSLDAPQPVLLTPFLFCFSLLVVFAFLLRQYLSVHFSPRRSMQLEQGKLFTLTAINSNELSLKIPRVQFYKMSSLILTSPSEKPPLQSSRV